MLTNEGAKFVEAGHFFIVVAKAPRLYWNNDKLEWTARALEATIFQLGAGMEEAGNVASKTSVGEVMIEDVTDKVQRAQGGIMPGQTAARRMRH